MEILILLGIWISVLGLAFSVIKKRVDADTKRLFVRTACKLHPWVYRDDANGGQYMVCDACGKLPGDDIDHLEAYE